MGKEFTKPDRPFLLLTEDSQGTVPYSWLQTEEELQEVACERRECGERITDAIEINGCRDIKVPDEYVVDNFIDDLNSAYEEAEEQGFDSITLIIDTDAEESYAINCTKHGFQCDDFDFEFEDLDSIAEALYVEKMIGKPTEIRIE